MIEDNSTNDTALNKLVLHALDIQTVKRSSVAQNALKNVLQSVNGTDEYIELVDRYSFIQTSRCCCSSNEKARDKQRFTPALTKGKL